jgi:hypothetical protein
MVKGFKKSFTDPVHFFAGLFTAIVGYTINNQSGFWSLVDFFFYPFALVKWIIYHQISLRIIWESFRSFFTFN